MVLFNRAILGAAFAAVAAAAEPLNLPNRGIGSYTAGSTYIATEQNTYTLTSASVPTASVPAASSAPASSAPASSAPASSAPASSAPASSASTVPIASSVVASTDTCTESSVPATSVPATSAPASSAVYSTGSAPATSVAASSVPASSAVYSTSLPAPAPESTYVASSPAGSAPETSPAALSTTYVQVTSSYVYTVTGTGTAPAAESGAPSVTTGGPCGTVTVTVTMGQSSVPAPASSPAPESSPAEESTTCESSAPASTPAPASTYVASSSVAPAPVSTPEASSSPATYATSQPTGSFSETSPSSGGGNLKGKRGLAVNGAVPSSPGKCAWWWNWASTGGSSELEYFPCLKDSSMSSQFSQAAPSASYLLGPNEVDMTVSGGGSPMTPPEACQLWMQYMQPHKGHAKLISPQFTSDNSPNSDLSGVYQASGLDWMRAFAAECPQAHVDSLGGHFYGGNGQSAEEQAQAFLQWVDQMVETAHELYGEGCTVFIPEFSALPLINADSNGINAAFMKLVIPELDSNPAVSGYSYFAAKEGLLTTASGDFTEIGLLYSTL